MSETTEKSDAKGKGSNGASEKPATEAKKDEERFDTDHLVANAFDLIGESPVAVAGALSSHSRKTHTLAQAKDETRKFLRRKVGA